ncbi:hypothetical protein [Bradyrhizobium sp. Ec3.3]|nr:hypothetical protein [Bradyrhizobium sp. Ec3.3]
MKRNPTPQNEPLSDVATASVEVPTSALKTLARLLDEASTQVARMSRE